MNIRSNLALIVAACALGACSIGGRMHTKLDVPPGGPVNAQEMVAAWDTSKAAERRCGWEQAGRVIGVDGKTSDTKKTNPSCGIYKP